MYDLIRLCFDKDLDYVCAFTDILKELAEIASFLMAGSLMRQYLELKKILFTVKTFLAIYFIE